MKPSNISARTLALVAALAVAAIASGCSILPGSERLDVYVLPLPAADVSPGSPAPAPVPWALRVVTPLAAGGISGARIAVMPQAQRMSVYEGVRWSEPTPDLLRNRLLEAFRADGRVLQLSSDQAGLHADFELDGDLVAFQSEYRGAVVDAVIRFDARLVARNSNRIVAVQRFELREPVAGALVPEVVEAFGRAADEFSSRIVNWTVEQGSLAHAAGSVGVKP